MTEKKQSAEIIPLKPAKLGPCPLCGQPGEVAFRPFCSKRCADQDLGHWLSETYRVASEEEADLEEGEEGQE